MIKQFSIIEGPVDPRPAGSLRTLWNEPRPTPPILMGVPNRFTGIIERWLPDGAESRVAAAPGTVLDFLAEEHVMVDGPRTSVKLMSLISPRQGMSRADFLQYWHDKHAVVAASIEPIWRHVRHYVQNHIVAGSTRGSAPGATAFGLLELYFDSTEAIELAFSQPEVAALRADEDNFLNRELSTRLFVVERDL
ncbi:MAG: EthD domain-containing protein [Janthinobacterium lividum]